MLIFQKKGAGRVLELYCIFIVVGTIITLCLNYIYYSIFLYHFNFNFQYVLTTLSGTILIYFIPIYYYNKFNTLNVIFYMNYSIILSICYTFKSIFMLNLNDNNFDKIYIAKLAFVNLLYIGGSLFLTYYIIMLYSFIRNIIFSKRLVTYNKDKNDWFL